MDVKTVGPHSVSIEVDPENVIDESNEHNNSFTNPHYLCRGIPDLALICHQVGNMMNFHIKNVGDGPSPETQVVFRQGRSINTPIYVGKILPHQLVVKRLQLDWHVVQIGEGFSACVNPDRMFPELKDDNNSCEGTITQPYTTTTQYLRDWQRWLEVYDKTSHFTFEGSVNSRQQSNSSPHVRFEFLLYNHHFSSITPPVQALLEINQGGNQLTQVYQVPELFPTNASGHVDTYHIQYDAPLSIRDGKIYYKLILTNGNEILQGAQGMVEEAIQGSQ